jgi:hypothetical protein
LPEKSKEAPQELMNSERWLVMQVIDMPMDKVTDEVKIHEMIEGGDELSDMHKIAKIGLKCPSVGVDGTQAFAELGWSSRDERGCRPGLKGGKGLLQVR